MGVHSLMLIIEQGDLHNTTFTPEDRVDLESPPSPPSLAIIGHLHLFLSPLIHKCFQRISSKYGPYLHLRIFHLPIVLVSSASMASEIFKSHDVNISSRGLPPIDESLFFGETGFFSAPHGDYWKFMKKLLITKLLGPHAIERLRAVRAEELDRFYFRFLEKAKKKECVDSDLQKKQRVVLEEDDDGDVVDESEMAMYDFEGPESPKQSSIFKFIALAEHLPDHARVVCDSLCLAIDIFLKVHPNMKDSEPYRLCKTISCQKLSQDASSHAAQNERLPIQIAVQVLFPAVQEVGWQAGAISPRYNYASVRRENRELRLEVARMRLTDLEKDHVSMKREFVKLSRRTRYGRFRKLSRGLMNKLNAIMLRFRRSQSVAGNGKHTEEKTNSEKRFMFQKRRCHSVSLICCF
ncbi:unnamed protein product [Brassica oleracea var. botrytis]